MNNEKIARNRLLASRRFSCLIPAFICAIIYICLSALAVPTAYAAGVPGGNIADPVVRGVDIAKPAVVRIVAKVTGRLTVQFPTGSTTFPQGGGAYRLDYTGSGVFISAHGDILTADHLVHPPPEFLYDAAAQDVADFYSGRSGQTVSANDVLFALITGSLRSQPLYDTPTVRAYLGTDFTGPINVTSLDAMPQETYASVDRILKTNDFQHGDTAVIHVPMENTPSIKLGDSTNVGPQDELTMIGFPGNGDLSGRSQANPANPSTGFFTASLNRVYVSALKQMADGVSLIQVGGNVEHGDSGGPALDNNGNVVGIASFGYSDGGGTSETNFLQASSTAQRMINELQLNTQPGAFQLAWSRAFAQYSSTEAGHWHRAQQQMQELQNDYPKFHAIQPFLNYATAQAAQETTTTSSSPVNLSLLGIVLLAVAVIFALVLIRFLVLGKRRRQTPLAIQSPMHQSLSPEYRPSLETERMSPSSSVAQIDLNDGADQGGGVAPDGQLAPSRVLPSPPLVPQTPRPVAVGAPVYGQPVPYGQQPHNAAASQPGPVQATPYPPYPVQSPYPLQQQQYMPYPLASVAPWPPVPDNTPLPPAKAPYASQNPAQQGASSPRGQQTPAYGAPYSQPPRNYEAMSAQPQSVQPAQSSQQSLASIPAQPKPASAPPVPDAAATSDEPTVRADQKKTSAGEEIVKPAEDKKNMAAPTPVLSEDETEVTTHLSERADSTGVGEE